MTGELTRINKTQAITKTFNKKEIIVSVNDTVGKPFAIFELLDGSISKIDPFKIGDGVRIQFIIQGRKYIAKNGEAKYFNNLIVKNIEKCDLLKVNSSNPPVTSFDNLK